MPPASRGWTLLRFQRSFSSSSFRCYAQRIPSKVNTKSPLSPGGSSAPRPPIPKSNKPVEWTKPIVEASTLPQASRFEILRSRILNSIPLQYRYILRWIGRFLLIAPPLTILAIHFPYEIMVVNGSSMSPFLNPNSSSEFPEKSDRIIVQKIFFPTGGAFGFRAPKLQLQRGQIVVFYTPHSPEKIAVKRIIGLPGDRVIPLPGYAGGDEPVVVQYNHLWVEGDVNNRDKSIDSNWYGPISQNLVIGVASAVFASWYRPVSIQWQKHKYPAVEQGRVEENVVQSAAVDPSISAAGMAFKDGRAETMLQILRTNPESVLKSLTSEQKRAAAQDIYNSAVAELQRNDPTTADMAAELIQELDTIYQAMITARNPQKTSVRRPKSKIVDDANQIAAEPPAQKALREYMERRQADKEKELQERDQKSAGWLKDAWIAPNIGFGFSPSKQPDEAGESS